MKSRLIELLVVVLIGVMLATNPTLDDYGEHLRQQVVEDTQGKDELSRGMASIFGGLAGTMLTNLSKRSNYLLFSHFETDMSPDIYHCIGVLGNFVNCGKTPAAQVHGGHDE
ncbi:MAG: hypothetical protein R3F42_00845 [Pseudomonadota bacterium]